MLLCSIPTREASKARARVGLHGGLSPLERHECPQNDPIPASCGSTTARMSSSWPCIRTPSPMSSCPEARASPRAWASFLPSSHGCGADRSSPVHTSYAPESDPPSCARRLLHLFDQVLQGGSHSGLMLGQIDRSLPQAGEVGVRKGLGRVGRQDFQCEVLRPCRKV